MVHRPEDDLMFVRLVPSCFELISIALIRAVVSRHRFHVRFRVINETLSLFMLFTGFSNNIRTICLSLILFWLVLGATFSPNR